MPTNDEYLALYGRARKVLLSRYFALGRYQRNDFFQESTNIEGFEGVAAEDVAERRKALLDQEGDDLVEALWRKQPADRDNPWLFGCKLTVTLATEARLGLPGADDLLGRALRSCERQFSSRSGFKGFPLRYDPVTSDDWMPVPGSPADTPPEQGICRGFLITPDGKDYILSTPPNDPRHFPYLIESTGVALMGRRLYRRYVKSRDQYIGSYRKWEPSQDEIVGVITTYVAVAEGTQDPALRQLARSRLRTISTYLSDSAYLMVLPRGGISARGPGDALPALEWPFAKAIARAVGDSEPAWSGVSYQDGLERAGVWELFKGPTDRAMALAWLLGFLLPDPIPNPTGAAGPLIRGVTGALAVWGAAAWSPRFLTPGNIGFVAGIYLARDGFDPWNDEAAAGMALAALLHSWSPEERFRNYMDYMSNYAGFPRPFSAGFVPFLGFLAVGGADTTSAGTYDFWLRKRRARGIDDGDPVLGWSRTCFASAVALLLNQGADAAEEQKLVELLDAQFDRVSTWPGDAPHGALREQELPIAEYHDVWAALDYVVSLALAWRYRSEREAAGATLPDEFPSPPQSDVVWPEPAVPRAAVTGLPDYVPAAAIQGTTPPAYTGDEARLFTTGSPERPAVSSPNLSFPDTFPIYDETFEVTAGPELFTGLALQWGDVWEITAEGTISGGGTTIGPEGGDQPVYDARYPVHWGRDPDATEYCLLARLNNYVVVKEHRKPERWLYPEETFLYLLLNQPAPTDAAGSFSVRVRVRGDRRDLTTLREVTCVTRDKDDPNRRIDGIGGVGRSGSRWWLSLDEAIEQTEQDVVFFVRQEGVPAVEITIRKRKGRPYLATVPDRARGAVRAPELRNNLSWKAMPECPSPE